MSGKIVQISGGDRESQDLYIGQPRELTVDTTNQDLRLHDGTTPGGKRILSMANADERYQAAAPELDGLTGFSPQNLGILVRVGPADYEFRQIEVDVENLGIDNAAGIAGNMILGLLATIFSAHTWEAIQTFNESIIANGGIQGDLLGNVEGNLTGNSAGTHTGPVVGDVTGNAAGNHTGSFVGDVDTREHTLLLGPNQVGFAALDATVKDYLDAMIPRRAIVMWSGLIEEIPTGWLLCDGTAGTPDLRDRFIVGAGGTYLEGDVGGSHPTNLSATTDDAGEHSHALTINGTALTVAQMPAHQHGNGISDDNVDSIMWRGTNVIGRTAGVQSNSGAGRGTIEGLTEEVGEGDPHDHTGSAANSGIHSHGFSIVDADFRPPFYALAYIMKDF